MLVCVDNFADSLFRVETTVRFSTTHEPSVSQSTPQRTQPGCVGSSSLMLPDINADIVNCSHRCPQSLYPQTPLNSCL